MYKHFTKGSKPRGNTTYTPTTSCITTCSFYHTIPGGYIQVCLYGKAVLEDSKTRDTYCEVKK